MAEAGRPRQLAFLPQDARAALLAMGGAVVDEGPTGIRAPDGGWGWAVLFGCFVITGFSYAFPKAVSVFFKELMREFGIGYSDTAWISSILLAMLYGTGKALSRPAVASGAHQGQFWLRASHTSTKAWGWGTGRRIRCPQPRLWGAWRGALEGLLPGSCGSPQGQTGHRPSASRCFAVNGALLRKASEHDLHPGRLVCLLSRGGGRQGSPARSLGERGETGPSLMSPPPQAHCAACA